MPKEIASRPFMFLEMPPAGSFSYYDTLGLLQGILVVLEKQKFLPITYLTYPPHSTILLYSAYILLIKPPTGDEKWT